MVKQNPAAPRRPEVTGRVLYVRDLDEWLAEYPEGPRREALLLHQQHHSERQLAAGVLEWWSRYTTDAIFMWHEEKEAWGREIRHLVSEGGSISAEEVAGQLMAHECKGDAMVSYAEALDWARGVLGGSAASN